MTISFSKAAPEKDGTCGGTCPICLDELSENIVKHDIGNKKGTHQFHEKCIKNWLAIRPECPLCFSPVDTSSLSTWKERTIQALGPIAKTAALLLSISSVFSMLGSCTYSYPLIGTWLDGALTISQLSFVVWKLYNEGLGNLSNIMTLSLHCVSPFLANAARYHAMQRSLQKVHRAHEILNDCLNNPTMSRELCQHIVAPLFDICLMASMNI